MIITYIIIAILSYLLGSIPFGYLFSKFKGVDITKMGSGNIGATNISRIFGLKWALLIGILDVLKGAVPVYFAKQSGYNGWNLVIICLLPIIGNVFSLWLNFKGGKAVSTTFGVLSVLLGWHLSLVVLLVWVSLLYLINLMSLTNLIIILFAPYLLYSLYDIKLAVLGFLVIIIIWYTHRKNIIRLISGQEPYLFDRQ